MMVLSNCFPQEFLIPDLYGYLSTGIAQLVGNVLIL